VQLKNKKKNIFIILSLIIFIFTSQSYIPVLIETISITGSSDFQWGPARCVQEGINHYQAFINKDNSCKIFMTQFGDYLHAFYIILYPLTFLDWKIAKISWLVINIVILIATIQIISKRLKLSYYEKLISYFFIFFCISVKIHFIMGQQALFTLFFLSLAFLKPSKKNYFLSGLCYVKYNIGYVLFLYLIVDKKIKNLLLTCAPIILGWFIYAYLTKTPLILNLFDPIALLFENFKVLKSLNHTFVGTPFVNLTQNLNFNLLIIITLIFLINMYYLIIIKRFKDNLKKLSLIMLLVLISFPHWSHDYILMIPLFMVSLKNFSLNMINKINFFVSIYFLHLHKAIFIYISKFLNLLNFDNDLITVFGDLYPYLNNNIK
jgi:hypothetical protein